MLQTRRRYFTPKWGQSWHQIGKCAMKSQTRSICHHSGHHIFPHTLMPPSETYIFLFFTATRIFPLQTLEVIWKLEHARTLQAWQHMAGAIVGIICVIFFGHIRFGSRASGGNSWKWEIWVMEGRSRWRSSGEINQAPCIFSPHFSMQTDVISLSNWVYLSYADSFWQVITQIKHGDALETALLLYDPQLVFTFHGTLQGIHAVFCHSTAFNSIREQDRGPRTL